jgi:Domain of unknown function (DUF1857)
MPAANHIAFTAPINPPGATPTLTRAQIWACLQRKIVAGQEFVSGAIASTDVVEEYTDEKSGNPVVVRDIVFHDGERRVRETCVAYEPIKVEFTSNGSVVMNVVSEDAEGGLLMTYVFEWKHPGMGEEELKEVYRKERALAQTSVESTIVAMREMVKDGRIQA